MGRSSSHGSRTWRRTGWPWSFCSPPWRAALQLAGRPLRLFCWGLPCSLSWRPRSLPGSNFCVLVALRERSRRISGASKCGLATATIEAAFFGLLAHRAWNPPPSSSLAEERRLRSLRAHCSLRSQRLALVSRCLPHSLADERTCLLAHSSRTAARQPGSARRRAIADARSSECGDYPVRRADSSAGVTNLYPTLRTVPMTDSYSGPSLARSRRTWTSTVRVPP